MNEQYCHSCTAPLNNADMRGASKMYCRYCADEKGSLRDRTTVKAGIANWLQGWQNIDAKQAAARADHFMKAMPAWAEK